MALDNRKVYVLLTDTFSKLVFVVFQVLAEHFSQKIETFALLRLCWLVPSVPVSSRLPEAWPQTLPGQIQQVERKRESVGRSVVRKHNGMKP